MSEAMETHEHAAHAAEHGRAYTALLIAVLAACLAFSEQGANHAETRQSEAALAAADTWAEYQAKSIRAADAANFADLVEAIGSGNPAASARLVARLRIDKDRYENDAASGKKALAGHAHDKESERDHAMLRLHAFENASAAFQLAIVLATASVIVGSVMLVLGAAGLGAVGVVLAVLALVAPGLGSF